MNNKKSAAKKTAPAWTAIIKAGGLFGGPITYTAADKREMVADAREYLRGRGIRATARMIEAQVAAEHGDDVAGIIARHLGIKPTPIARRDGGYYRNVSSR